MMRRGEKLTFADTGDNSTAHKNNLHIDVWLVGCVLVGGGY